jgi:hypothetical protein
MLYKECDVIIIHHENIDKLSLDSNPYHMHILSNDEINSWDLCYNKKHHNIITGNLVLYTNELPFCKKIIATTDTTLGVYRKTMNETGGDESIFIPLAHIPEWYVNYYDASNIKNTTISNVLVKYKDNGYEDWFGDDYTGEPVWIEIIELYLDKNHTIDIYIELSNNTHEMHLNMQYYYEYCLRNPYVTPQEWIEKYKHF